MAIKLTDEGGMYILNCLFNGATLPATLYVQLFGHATVPVTSLADTDVNDTHYEISGGGYSSKTITASQCAVSLAAGGIPEAAWDVLEWTFSGTVTANGADGATIYGYQVISQSDAAFPVMFEELFAAPFKPTTAGDILRLTPKLLLGNGTPA